MREEALRVGGGVWESRRRVEGEEVEATEPANTLETTALKGLDGFDEEEDEDDEDEEVVVEEEEAEEEEIDDAEDDPFPPPFPCNDSIVGGVAAFTTESEAAEDAVSEAPAVGAANDATEDTAGTILGNIISSFGLVSMKSL